jgi:hypothetical protein
MQSPDLHILIPELAGLYDTLNERWGNDPCATDVYQVYRQKEYRDVYEQLKDISIESIVLRIIADAINGEMLSRLRGLLADNLKIYEIRQDVFSNIDFDRLYPLWEDYLFGNKKATLLKDRETITHYPYQSERERELLLKENQQDINELDNERNDLRHAEAVIIGKNYYQLIYELSRTFAAILNSYFPVEKEKTQKTAKPAITQGIYFDMKLVSAIHNQCNNIQFDNITETDLYALLNLQATNAVLAMKSGERTRVCYLIYKLYKHLKIDNRAEWRTVILDSAGIKEDYYKSKYKEPISEIPSRKSESFAQHIDRIFRQTL